MKTKWGSCKIAARRIWLNLELAKSPSSAWYIIVHELSHLIERHHNDRFIANTAERRSFHGTILDARHYRHEPIGLFRASILPTFCLAVPPCLIEKPVDYLIVLAEHGLVAPMALAICRKHNLHYLLCFSAVVDTAELLALLAP